MKKIALRAINLVVIFSCMTLLQWHGIQFWLSFIDEFYIGIGWSLLLELVAMWAWFQRKSSQPLWMHYIVRGIASIATVLLLIGPLHAVSAEFIQSYETTYVQTQEYEEERELLLEQIEAKQEASRELLAHIRENDDGWITYNRTQRDLERLQQELNDLEPPSRRITIPWQEVIVTAMQALAILIFQLIIVLAILKTANLAEEPPKQQRKPLTYRELLEARRERQEEKTSDS